LRISQLFRRRSEPPRAPDPTRTLRFLLHLPNFARLYVRLFRDRRVPLFPKALLVAALVYVLVPFDLLPDWLLPFVGGLDDVLVVTLALRAFIPLCPRAVVEEHVALIDQGK
jgi:uncharacterized membrane protein YkvA (DUF1232 family)